MANGDLLYHDIICFSKSKQEADFQQNFEYVKPWLKQADLVLGDLKEP